VAVFLAVTGAAFCEQMSEDTAKKLGYIVATDYPSINDAIAAARETGMYRIYIPAGVYEITETINLSGFFGKKEAGIDHHWTPFFFEGAGLATVFVGKTGKDPVIDMTGSIWCVMKNFRVEGVDADVGILLARRSPATAGLHEFQNIMVAGAFKTAAVYSWDSENNRYYNCTFTNSLGDGFLTTTRNDWNIKSPYQKMASSCNSTHRFWQCRFGATGKDNVALRVHSGSDILINGCYFYTGKDAYAAIYINNAASCISLREVRFECESKYCLYAFAAVSNVLIEGGVWCCGTGTTAIRQVDVPEDKSDVHKIAFSGWALGGRAYNWTIRGTNISALLPLADTEATDRETEAPSAMHFDSLQDSTIENVSFAVQYSGDKSGEVPSDAPIIKIDKYSRRNTFVVASRESVILGGDAKNNYIDALCDGTGDKCPPLWLSGKPKWHFKQMEFSPGLKAGQYFDGIRRKYVMPDEGISLTNLGVIDVRKISKPKAGDIAIHDGSGFSDKKKRFAFFNGRQWIFFEQGKGFDAR